MVKKRLGDKPTATDSSFDTEYAGSFSYMIDMYMTLTKMLRRTNSTLSFRSRNHVIIKNDTHIGKLEFDHKSNATRITVGETSPYDSTLWHNESQQEIFLEQELRKNIHNIFASNPKEM